MTDAHLPPDTSKAERDAKALFETIAKEHGDDEARRIFSDVLKRPRGRRQTDTGRQIDGFLRFFLKEYPEMTAQNLANFVIRWFRVRDHETGEWGPSRVGTSDEAAGNLPEEALMQRIKRLKKKMRAN